MEGPKKPYHTPFKGSDKASPLSGTGETAPNPAPSLAPARCEELGLGLPTYPSQLWALKTQNSSSRNSFRATASTWVSTM